MPGAAQCCIIQRIMTDPMHNGGGIKPLEEAAIGFGSNLGDRRANLREALERLKNIDGVELVCKSGIYETDPVDVPDEFSGLTFLNAVAIFRVRLEVDEWSAAVHAVEDALLRVRGKVRNTPRTIDLDLLYFGDTTLDTPTLRLPHPQCTSRRFVCEPLCELRPGFVLPGEVRTIAQILAGLPAKPGVARIDSDW